MDNNEQQMYVDQIELWVKEQRRLKTQLQRTIAFHHETAVLNQMQLEIHDKRINLSLVEYNEWASQHGQPAIEF